MYIKHIYIWGVITFKFRYVMNFLGSYKIMYFVKCLIVFLDLNQLIVFCFCFISVFIPSCKSNCFKVKKVTKKFKLKKITDLLPF